MVIPDYSIVSPDINAVDWNCCRLIIEVNQRFFHYIILEEDKVIALKYYSTNGKPILESLEDIFSSDELLQREKGATAVIYNTPDNHLVPDNFFDDHLNKDWVSVVNGDLKRGTVLHGKIDNTSIHTVYRIPEGLHRFFEEHLSAVQYHHHYNVWTKDNNEDGVQVIFYPNELLVRVIVDGRLQVIQNYTYHTAEDVGYYLLNIFHQFNLSPLKTPLQVSGMIVTDSALYEELLKYFLSVELMPASDKLRLEVDSDNYPSHFFSPLLNMALCV